jgi:hypothetical protein
VLTVQIHTSASPRTTLSATGFTSASTCESAPPPRTVLDLVEMFGRFARREAFDEPISELCSEALDFRAASESLALAGKLPHRHPALRVS